MTTYHEYQVSQRVTLRPGDRFLARGGPYYQAPDGTRHAMGDKGPFTFQTLQAHRGRRWIVATSSHGLSVLMLNGPRRSLVDCVVWRPYRVLGRVGPSRRQRTKGGAA